jgi:transcriptional regulator with XRE-family HTH domain
VPITEEAIVGLFKKTELDKWDARIGEKIKESREEAKLTQAQLGSLIYKSQGNISDYEAGRHSISALDLFLLAHAVDKPPDFFVPHPYYAPKNYADLTLKEQELIHFIRTIGGDERQANIVDLLIEQAKRLTTLIIDTDAEASRKEVDRHTQRMKK